MALFALIVTLHLCAAAARVDHGTEYCEAEGSCQRVSPGSALFHDEENDLFDSLKLAERIAKEHNQMHYVPDVQQMKNELSTKVVRVGFVGMMKVGKSTTLNALLHKRYLPSAIQAETAIEVVITHDRNKPEGVLTGENFTNSTEELAKGDSNIHRKLEDLNKQKRFKQNLYKRLWLNITIPFLSALSKNFSLTISDTPGSDEAVVESLDLDKSIEHLAAFVIVLDYRKMKSDAEISLLKSLKQLHQSIFNTPERLLFILNHINTFHEHRAARMKGSVRPSEAPKFVAEYLKQLLQVNISPSQVMPYSAYWALESRICLDDPDKMDDKIMEEAQFILRNIEQSDGADDSSTNTIAICKTLEKYSKILDIEDRLIQLFVKFGQKVIERNIADKVLPILTNLLSTITSKIEELGVVEKNKTVLHQKQKIVAVDQIISGCSHRLNQSLYMHRTSTLTNMSSTWTATIAVMMHAMFHDLDAVVFNNYSIIRRSVQNATIYFTEKVVSKMNQSYHDIVHYHSDIALQQLQEQWMTLQQELTHIMSSPLPKMLKFDNLSLLLPESFSCILSTFDIKGIVREQNLYVPKTPTYWYCSFFKCADEGSNFTVFAVKTFTLNNRMTESLNSCFIIIESALTKKLDSFSSSAKSNVKNSIENWWKAQKPKEDEILQVVELNLQNAIGNKKLLDEERAKLEDAIQNVNQTLGHPT